MAQSIAELSLRGSELELVPLDQIDFDPQNPNQLDATTYEALKAEIQRSGFNQPVLLWRQDERFRCIDGEHRIRALGDLGAESVPALITDAGDEDEARLRLLTMNKLRGSFAPVRLALMLADLVQRVPEKELRRRLAMDEAELRDNLRMANFTDDVGEALREHVKREAKEAPVTLRFVMNARDAEVVERVIEGLIEGKRDRGQALAYLCKTHEKTRKGAAA